MSKQPESLRLADLIERYNSGVHSQAIVEDYSKAAAELRRLHDINAELLEALNACDEAMSYMSEYDIPLTLPSQVKDALAKAEGRQS